MKINRFLLATIAVLLGVTLNASAEFIGKPAPPLQVGTWIKGQPVDLAAVKGKQIVVVEFWATWCPPCRASIPHLTELQKKFKDVIFVSISDEDPEIIKPFVKKMGAEMEFNVGADDAQKTVASYMAANKIEVIPHAFVVNKDGNIVWVGSPLMGMGLEEALNEIVAGKFDLEKSKRRMAGRDQLTEFRNVAINNPDEPQLEKLGKDLEALEAEVGRIEPGRDFKADEFIKQVRFQGLIRDYQIAWMSNSESTNLVAIEKKLQANAPAGFELAEFKKSLANGRTLDNYMIAAQKGDTNALVGLSKQVGELEIKDPRLLLQVAATILDEGSLKVHDYELAAKLSKTAVDLTGSKEPVPLFVYARAQYESGKADDAITSLKKAIETVGDNAEIRKQLEETLKTYQEKLAKK